MAAPSRAWIIMNKNFEGAHVIKLQSLMFRKTNFTIILCKNDGVNEISHENKSI